MEQNNAYTANLELLEPHEQEFIVTVLKWAVWTVSGVTVFEMADHYKSRYGETIQQSSTSQAELRSHGPERQSRQEPDSVVTKPVSTDPYDDPEIKDIISRIESTGRDFFKFDKDTGFVSVEASVKQWVQEATQKPKSAIKGSPNFSSNVYKLFDEKEAHMSLAISALQALNHDDFQTRYMPWKPEWLLGQPKQQRRYEIDHWQDHIRILQKWWTDDSLNDSGWSELVTQLSIFTKSENCQRWNLQRGYSLPAKLRDDSNIGVAFQDEYFFRLFEEPIHIACRFGLPLFVELLVRYREAEGAANANANVADPSAQSSVTKAIKIVRVEALIQRVRVNPSSIRDFKKFYPGVDCDELFELIELQYIKDEAQGDSFIMKELKRETNRVLLKEWISESVPVCQTAAPDGKLPLQLAAGSPETISKLIQYGADVNQEVYIYSGRDRYNMGVSVLLVIINDILRIMEGKPDDDKKISPMLRSMEILLTEGAEVKLKGPRNATILHLAARARNLEFFEKVCAVTYVREWYLTRDHDNMTPLHHLFRDPRPRSGSKVQEVLEMCRRVVKMNEEDQRIHFVNAKDGFDMDALAHAVTGRFKEGVELLIGLGANIFDNIRGSKSYFSYLAEWNDFETDRTPMDPEADFLIANILLNAGTDLARQDSSGATPLHAAVLNGKWHLVQYLLPKYDQLANQPGRQGAQNPILSRDKNGLTLFHALAMSKVRDGEETIFSNIFEAIKTRVGKSTDVGRFIRWVDFCDTTPLVQCASRTPNFEAVKLIIATNPDTTSDRNHTEMTALEIVAKEIRERFGLIWEEQRLKTIAKIFNYILPRTPLSEVSFSIITETVLEAESLGLDRQALIKHFDLPFRDGYGWTLFDYLCANNTLRLVSSYMSERTPTPLQNLRRPSRMCFLKKVGGPNSMALSTKGLHFITDGLVQQAVLISNYPVPHNLDRTFYFEIQPDKFGNTNYVLGLKLSDVPSHDILCEGDFGRISIDSKHSKGYDWPYSQYSKATYDPRLDYTKNPFPLQAGPSRSPVGCGINLKSRVVFFTLNGEMMPGVWKVPHARYSPYVKCRGFDGGLSFNFGAEPFKFEQANDPEWQWDWEKSQSEWGKIPQPYDDPE
ncbi:hypothetical protein ABW20_dc0103803 [Dactylellina cionopaga]|nr:hypothetical protein ABW20_dc0103803 [Dactylellina cionopaga]